MSRYKPYGKSKSHGSSGFQFDKLLKVCSNSKKTAASATKTVGALGRFGSTNFTSTRNSHLDSSGEDDRALYKRPRLDVGNQMSSAYVPSYDYPMIQNQNIPGSYFPQGNLQYSNTNTNSQSTANPEAFKPKKFFKSRNPLGVVDPKPFQPPPVTSKPVEHQNYIPPITIPIPKLSGSLNSTVKPNNRKPRGKASEPKVKPKPSKRQSKIENDSRNANAVSINISPPAITPPASLAFNNNNSTSLTSPSIKLRIFKDKKTSTFVSVSDASPPKLQRENSPEKKKEKRKPGRPKKQKPEPVVPPPVPKTKVDQTQPPGRITRNRKKLRNSDSSVDSSMPVLRRASQNSTENNSQEILPNLEHTDSGPDLVKKLEEEDDEFRQMSEILSSMEGGVDDTTRTQPKASISNPVQDIINTGLHSPERNNECNSSPKSKNIRSVLEDEWSDDEDSPKKGSQTPKQSNVSRFDMAAFMPEHSSVPQAIPLPDIKDESPTDMTIPTPPHQSLGTAVFNAPYAVRNLLADFTEAKAEVELNNVSEEVSTKVPSETQIPQTTVSSRGRIIIKRGVNAMPQVKQTTGGATKKASIFKSRAATASNQQDEVTTPKKRIALYKHKFGQESAEKPENLERKTETVTQVFGEIEEKDEFDQRGIRIKNVKATHELQESGEVLEFDGDILYILDDLKDKNPISSRCLSAITLAMRCMEPAFRMHLRAHGTVGEFCQLLHDAPNNPVLALLAATVLFVLSQDRLNMDLDTDSLQLLLALTKIEEQTHLLDESPELSKHRQRVIDLVTEVKQMGHAKDLKIERISASEIALETLLHLTSKRAGEWVKHELRTLGGLDYIVSEVHKLFRIVEKDFEAQEWTENVKERLTKVDRCLRVLQQVSFNHEENQRFLLGVKEHSNKLDDDEDSLARRQYTPVIFVRLFRFCTDQLEIHPKDSEIAQVLREILFTVLRVLVNLTHDYRGIVLGSEVMSAQEGLVDMTLYSVFNLCFKFPDEKVFDVLMHSLCMLLNLVEYSRLNRSNILSTTVHCSNGDNFGNNSTSSSLDAFMGMFFVKEREAKKEEYHTDDILTNSTDGKGTKESQNSTDSQKNSQDKDSEGSSLQDVIDKLIQTAGKHMENSLIAAYISLLLAYIVMDDPDSREYVRNSMPDAKFLPLMVFLKKLFNFMSITSSASGSTRGLKATSIALKFFAQHDPGSNEELKKIIPD